MENFATEPFQVRQQGKPQNIYYDPAHASSHDFLYKPVRLRRQYTARNNCAYSQAGAFYRVSTHEKQWVG